MLAGWSENLATSSVEREDGSFRVRHIDGGMVDIAPTAGGSNVVLREPALMITSKLADQARACL